MRKHGRSASDNMRRALKALNHGLDVLQQHDDNSHAPRATDRRLLAEICRDRVSAVHRGDEVVAREIIADYIKAVNRCSERSWTGPNHFVYARYIADAFKAILDGKPADVALGIKNSRPGRRKGARTHEPKVLAAAYWLLVRKGMSKERAIERVTVATGADRTTVQAARKARYTIAFGYPNLVSDRALQDVVGAALLRTLEGE